MSFFKDHPTLFYNGQQAKNILARARLTKASREDASLYYPYTIRDRDGRPDNLADAYYGDPFADWLVFFANDVVDPYFDLGLGQTDFDAFIKKKYGSIEVATSTTVFFRTNWELLEDSTITVQQYESLPAVDRSYWVPVLDAYGLTASYGRNRDDLMVNTNRVLELTVDDTSGFLEGERVFSMSDNATIETVTSPTTLNVRHVFGIGTPTIGKTVVGSRSRTEAQVTGVVTLAECLTPEIETKYWTPVDAYQYETELNTSKRNVHLIDARHKTTMESELKRVLKS